MIGVQVYERLLCSLIHTPFQIPTSQATRFIPRLDSVLRPGDANVWLSSGEFKRTLGMSQPVPRCTKTSGSQPWT